MRGQGRSSTDPRRLSRRIVGLIAALVALLIPVGLSSARETTEPSLGVAPEASISKRQAIGALQRATALVAGQAPQGGRELTIALRDLAIAVPRLSGADKRRAKALLARPTDGLSDPQGDGYTASLADQRSVCSANFCVHYVVSTGDVPDLTDLDPPNGTPDFVDAVAVAAESSYAVENGELDWRKPKSDGVSGGSSKTDIYLKNIGGNGLFGYAAPDPGQGSKRRQFAYLVIDNDYRPSQFPTYASPTEPMKVTVAHEYNHILQFAYDTFQEAWLFESTATWMEGRVFPEIDDYVDVFVPAFTRRPETPLSDPDTNKIYGNAVWHHFLSDKFDPSVSREAWESSTDTAPKDFAIGAFSRVLQERGSSFSREFARFAPETAEWRATKIFPDRYPDVKRKGTLAAGQTKSRKLDHASYLLYDVDIADIASAVVGADLKLIVKTKRKARSALALVARRGGVTSGNVNRRVKFLRKGGRGTLTLPDYQEFDRITAVVVNADGRVKGHDGGDFRYSRDNVRYAARLTVK